MTQIANCQASTIITDMTTTLQLPEDLARAVERRAAAGGRDVAAEVVELVRKGLSLVDSQERSVEIAPSITTDPITGLPRIEGAADAPISRMTTEQIYALLQQTQEQEDLERAGIPLRR
jgi:plasmid stability protein